MTSAGGSSTAPAWLADDFAVRRDDIPQQPDDDEPGRALPVGVLNQLITALPALEESAGPAVRAAAELFMDTGRRPAEICRLSWDCLDQDSDGKYAWSIPTSRPTGKASGYPSPTRPPR